MPTRTLKKKDYPNKEVHCSNKKYKMNRRTYSSGHYDID